jgi:hypothetical protein
MATATHKLVVIQDNTLRNMAAQKRFTKEFPFLTSLNRLSTSPKKTCGGCRNSNKRVSETYAAAKRALSSMPTAKKQKLKELFGAKKIRITYRQPGGKVIELTF